MERLLDGSSPIVREARLAFEFSLANLLWKQAVFYAERLMAECMCDESSYLLALAYFHKQEPGRACRHLQGNRLPEARYLLGKCCFQLQKWDEAEDALAPGPPGCTGCLPEVVNGAAGLFLLGQVKERQAKREQAVECYVKCLELCPFMWDAYERWSWLVLASPSPSRASTTAMASNTFSDDRFAQMASSLQQQGFGSHHSHSMVGHAPARMQQLSERAPLLSPSSGGGSAPVAPSAPGPGSGGGLSARPSQNAPPRNSDHIHKEPLSHAGQPRKERRASEHQQQRLSAGGSHRDASGGGPTPQRSGSRAVPSPAPLGDSGAIGGGLAGSGTNSVGDVGSGAISTLASLLCRLGLALHSMHSFENQQAIQFLNLLPRRHYETGYVLDLVGLCYFESADYKKAAQVYQHAWRLEPQRVEGLEHYSSALWHLRRDVDLGRLAQQCLQWDRLKPQVWCVVGNCFSLQKEHDIAIKFFKRAIQVDPSFSYAYTLCGHELVANEKFDKAIPMYEHALNIDSRHYNAWWGLGNIYHRQEEHENARYHFLKALEINKNNSVLRCYLGMVLESLNNPLMALESFDWAAQDGEAQNGMAYFQKACVLMSLERYEEALVDLKNVRYLAPKEACVHFQLGKVYMKLQRDKKALLHFNTAMDLNRDSKDYHTIKTHIERLHIRGISQGGPDPDVSDDRGTSGAPIPPIAQRPIATQGASHSSSAGGPAQQRADNNGSGGHSGTHGGGRRSQASTSPPPQVPSSGSTAPAVTTPGGLGAGGSTTAAGRSGAPIDHVDHIQLFAGQHGSTGSSGGSPYSGAQRHSGGYPYPQHGGVGSPTGSLGSDASLVGPPGGGQSPPSLARGTTGSAGGGGGANSYGPAVGRSLWGSGGGGAGGGGGGGGARGGPASTAHPSRGTPGPANAPSYHGTGAGFRI